MKNIIVWSWSKDPSLIPIERLISESEINVVAWFSMRGNKTFKTKNFSYIPAIALKAMATQGRMADVFYDQGADCLAQDLNKFIDIYSRVNMSKGMDYFDHLNLFHLYYQYFSGLIIRNNVQHVIFFTMPHAGADYVLYLAAKHRGVDVVLTLQSQVPNRFFCISEVEDFGEFKTCPPIGEPTNLTIPRGFKKDLFYMKNKYMKKVKGKRGLLLSRFFRDVYYAIWGGRQPIRWAGVIQKLEARASCRRLYEDHVIGAAELDLQQKFVYFPLQLQPELTTSVLGGEFSDQILAIEKLAGMLPPDWRIYAKENPKQGFQQRGEYFYERLGRVPNCFYIGDDVSTYMLLEKCQFVASITGTACWESISGGKPALIFGNVWFKTLPGITTYRAGLSVRDVMEVRIIHEDLESRYNEVMGKTIPGVVDMRYTEICEDFDPEVNGRLLTDFLRRYFASLENRPQAAQSSKTDQS